MEFIFHHPEKKTSDKRYNIYKAFHGAFLENEERENRICAQTVLETLFGHFKPKSVLDVGCGLGTWLSVARSLGVEDIYGIEGPWVNSDQLRIDPLLVSISDLEFPFRLGRRFDLVMSLETAEHLTMVTAETFVESLVSHGDIILFSAAIPQQGGHHHINEQWQSFWIELFERSGFACLHFLRNRLWENGRVFWHVRQNMNLFVSKKLSRHSPHGRLFEIPSGACPVDMVHPETYGSVINLMDQLMQVKRKYDSLIDFLHKEGSFIAYEKDGELNLSRSASRSATAAQLNDKGKALFEKGNLQRAASLFKQAAEIDPDASEPYNNLAVLHWRNDQADDAIETLSTALRINPDDLDATLNFGEICHAVGQTDRARNGLEAYLKRNPGADEVRDMLNRMESTQGHGNR